MSRDNRNFRGVWIPAHIWESKHLSLQEKVMLIEIDSLQHPKRGCFKSNAKFAEFFGLSPSRVSEIISSLAAKGLVRVVQVKEGKQTVERQIFMLEKAGMGIRDADEVFGKPKGGIRKTEGGYSENTEERGSVRGITDRGKPCANALRDAFEIFYDAGLPKKSRARAEQSFIKQSRKQDDPTAFAEQLAENIKTRLAAGELGFDKLHPSTYMNQQRWLDELPEYCPHIQIVRLWNSIMPDHITKVSEDDWVPGSKDHEKLQATWEHFKTKPRTSTGKPVYETVDRGLEFFAEVFRRLANSPRIQGDEPARWCKMTWAIGHRQMIEIYKGEF